VGTGRRPTVECGFLGVKATVTTYWCPGFGTIVAPNRGSGGTMPRTRTELAAYSVRRGGWAIRLRRPTAHTW
jgi:hypothetical protein